MDCAPRAACLFGEAYSFTTVDCALPVDCVDVGAWSIEVVIFEAIASLLAERVGTAADTIAIASASSKTAIGLAHLLSTHKVHPCHIVGLTSERNLDFARGTGVYDRVVTYDDREILNSGSVAVADFSGNSALIRKLQDALA